MCLLKLITSVIIIALLAGCASPGSQSGQPGPEIVTSGYVTQSGQYAEIGVRFTAPGDFVALLSPSRWKSPLATGGALSWTNPNAWKEDQSRTCRVLFGQAILVGGIVALTTDSGGSGSSSGGSSEPPPPDGPPDREDDGGGPRPPTVP